MKYENNYILSFEPSAITVIKEKMAIKENGLNILFQLCVESVDLLKRDALFIDGWNSFDPYTILRMIKNKNKKILSRIHVARAFTGYQMDAIIKGLNYAIEKWNPAILTISNLSALFSNENDVDKKLLETLIEYIKIKTHSSGIITVLTVYGEKEIDKIITSRADKIINVKIDDLPYGQKRIDI